MRIAWKGLLWSLITLLTLECCARLDDWISFGAPPLGIYDRTLLNAYDDLGEHGRPYGQYLKWKLNRFGFRGPEIDPDAVHVMCIGSSETFGQAESEGNEWPRQVERLLNQDLKPEKPFQVVNTGFPGETFPTSVLRLQTRLAIVHPRLVLMYPSLAHYLSVPFIPAHSTPPAPTVFRWRMQGRIETVLKTTLPETFQTWLRQRDIDRSLKTFGPIVDSMPVAMQDKFQSDLERAIREIRAAGAEPVLITHANRFKGGVRPEERFMLIGWRRFYPMLREEGFLPMEATMNGILKRVGAAQSVFVIDAAPAMPPGPVYFNDFVHFTDAGARIFSTFVADRLTAHLRDESAQSAHN